jgi:limonene-1,2-epoxide hydrolase
MAAEIKAQNKVITDLRLANASAVTTAVAKAIADDATKALTERVDWLVWMMRGVIVAGVLEVIVAVVVAFIVKGSK